MELKPPKAKKKSNVSRLISWGKMYRTPLLMLFLLGTTNCDDGESTEDLAEYSVPILNNSNFKPIDNILNNEHLKLRHRHTHILPKFNRSLDTSDRQMLSDIKYLRRHLNKEIVNFVMTDYLIDGEVENRVHFDGITAKETAVGADGHGLKLRQLTDGRHLLQVIYAPNGAIQDCEVITQGRSARNFLKTLRKELKLALDEESYRILQKDSRNLDNEKFFRHFNNMTVKILKNGQKLPSDVAEWLNYDRLKIECLERHKEMTLMMENRNKVSENSLT
ncbi:uncharacterized protein ACR2FA_009155, partial [Aphomia sociella]